MIAGLTQSIESKFVEGLPALSCVTDNYTRDGIERKTKRYAVTYKNIQYNPNSMVRAFCYDVDSSNGLHQWSDNNCLPPNWISVNPKNGHAHYGYLISAPVSRTFKSKPKPQLFANAINKGMTVKLGADKAYGGFMTKNPLHECWSTYTLEENAYDLNDLADDVNLIWKATCRSESQSGELGRNCTLFEQLRQWAYRNVQRHRTYGTKDSFLEATRATADSYNSQFDEPLSPGEVKSVAKSVATWTYKHYTGDGKNRGVCELASKGHGLAMSDRQSIGAAHTNRVRKEATEKKIMESVAFLKTSGKKVNVSSVAVFSGLSRPTVNAYKHLLKV